LKRMTLGGGAGLAAALLLMLGPMAPASAGSSTPAPTGISLRPAHVNPNHASSYFTLRLAAGARTTQQVLVTNPTAKPVTLLVNPVDGLTGATTGAVYANRGIPTTKAGAWASVSVRSVLVPAHRSLRVAFTVRVPQNASPGDHLAGIAFQNAKITTSTTGFKVREIVRNVIGVLIVVPGPAVFHPRLVSLGIHAVGSTGIGSVLIGLGNNGLALAQPSLTVSLDGPNNYHRTLHRHLDTVLPGDTIVYSYPWPDSLSKGSYDVTATLSGDGATATLQRTVQLGATLAGNIPRPHAAASHSTSFVPALIGGFAAALVMVAIVWLIMRRRFTLGPGPRQRTGTA
jgi:hypothetical protein